MNEEIRSLVFTPYEGEFFCMKLLRIFTILLSNFFFISLSADENGPASLADHAMISNLVTQEEKEIAIEEEDEEDEEDDEEED